MLQQFGIDLAETELPNDVQCTKDLLITHTEKHDKLKVAIHIYGTVVHVVLMLSYDLFNPCCYNSVLYFIACICEIGPLSFIGSLTFSEQFLT